MKKIIFTTVIVSIMKICSANRACYPETSGQQVSGQIILTDSTEIKVKSLISDYCSQQVFEIKNAGGAATLVPKIDVNQSALEQKMVKLFGEVGEETVWDVLGLFNFLNYASAKNPESLNKLVFYKSKLVSKYPNHRAASILNSDAYFIFKNTSDANKLKAALEWSELAIAKKPIGNYYDTYGNILYKLGKKSEAIAALEKALTVPVGNDGGSTDEFKSNLKKMRIGEKTW